MCHSSYASARSSWTDALTLKLVGTGNSSLTPRTPLLGAAYESALKDGVDGSSMIVQ